MSVPLGNSRPHIDGRWIAIALLCLCLALIVSGLISENQPVVAFAAIVAVPSVFILIRRPDSAVPLVLFLICSNAAVVAVRFHGVPALVAALAPAPLAVPLFLQLIVRGKPVIAGTALPWMLAFTGWQLISALFSSDPDSAMDGVLGTVLEGVVLYILITNVVRDERTLRHAVWALVAAGIFMGSISAFQQATKSFDTDFGGFGQLSGGPGFRVADGRGSVRQRRLAGPIGEKNRYAQVMLILIPLAVSRFWTHRNRWLRILALYGAMVIGVGAALTFSRSGAIVFALMVLLAVPLRFVSPRKVAILVVGGMLVLLAVPQYRTRLETIPSAFGIINNTSSDREPDGAIRGRATEMLAAARIAVDYPLLGVGPDLSSAYIPEYGQAGGLRALEGKRQAHCMYLEIPAETGFPGLMLFLGMVTASLSRLYRASRTANQELSQTGAALLLSMVGYLLMGIFLHMSYVRYFWMLLAMVDAGTYVLNRSSHTRLSETEVLL